jgi:UPF0755 protein
MSLSDILDKIARGDVSALWVTIPEGYTGQQIARVLASKKLVNDAVFTQDVYQPDGAVTAPFIAPNGSLEGYPFPDTYLVPFHGNPHSVVKLMLDNFDKRVVKGMAGEIQASGMSLHQIITVASMIEREARVPEDRPLIASVIYNRLRQGMPLQIDATVEYALGGHRARIYYRDLKVDSPYNTYRHRGLPLGPISNPGLSSIQAALHQAATDYLFYVAGPDGRHLFSRTVQEHGEAIQKVRRGE